MFFYESRITMNANLRNIYILFVVLPSACCFFNLHSCLKIRDTLEKCK